jgi:hypothetical protein
MGSVMKRREFLRQATWLSATVTALASPAMAVAAVETAAPKPPEFTLDPNLPRDWLQRWEKSILSDRRNRYCDKETGEELGWLVSPFLNGFYYGFLATQDPKWLEMLTDWMDACLQRRVKEPDGFFGWPKQGESDGGKHPGDSLLGEAMLLRPAVLMAKAVRGKPGLAERWQTKAESYVKVAEEIFAKWDSRGCWRTVKEGGVWVVPAFGIDPKTGKWTAEYAERGAKGFTNPDNKQNHIARWLLSLAEVTQKPVYRERAKQWFQVMKSRMKTREGDKYFVWNYWEPAGAWDYNPNGSPRHWVGVHPNGGYYEIDVEGIVAAHKHGLVFSREDIHRLIATNRDYMWNQQLHGAKFKRIDGGEVDERWKNAPGVLWNALIPYDATLRNIFLENHDPGSWGGISSTPWFLSLGKE